MSDNVLGQDQSNISRFPTSDAFSGVYNLVQQVPVKFNYSVSNPPAVSDMFGSVPTSPIGNRTFQGGGLSSRVSQFESTLVNDIQQVIPQLPTTEVIHNNPGLAASVYQSLIGLMHKL